MSQATSGATVTTETRGRVALIGLARPDKLNAFNLAMLRALAEAYTAYEDDPGLWCAVLFAHGKSFTAGLDLAEVGPAVARGDHLFPDGLVDPLDLPALHGGGARRRTKPVVCAVQGHCLTIGMELCMASDVVVAADDARFSQLEVQRGIMPFGGATLRFARIAGWGDAMRWMLTGERFDAAEARRIGLVQEVAPAGEHLPRAIAIAESIAAAAPLAVQATLAAARAAREQGEQAAIEVLMAQARRLMQTEDAREGMMSFIQRRQAAFSGK